MGSSWKRIRHLGSTTPLLAVGVVFLALPFAIPSYWSVAGYGMGFIDWPGAFGLTPLGLGLISVGVLYLAGGAVGTLFERTRRGRFTSGLVVFFLGFPLLIATYWVFSQAEPLLQSGWQLPTDPWFVLALPAFSYAPILLGIPFGYASTSRQEHLVVLLAAYSAGVPAVFWLVVAEWGFLAPFVWAATVAYDGVVAYPLYRFTKRSNTAR